MARSDKKKLILLIEDERDLLDSTQMLLEMLLDDATVFTARDGQQGLRLLEVLEPDVIVTDMMMPVLDGFGFLREYRGHAGASPVIATSAFEPYLERAIDMGADAILPKPYEVKSLAAMIRELIAREPVTKAPPRPVSGEEEGRLRAILDLNLDQKAPEPELEEFIDRVAAFFEMPVALISAVTADRQVWSAACGLPEDLAEARGTPRHQSFCTHAVAARAALVVQDTHDNPFFRDNVLVKTRGLRFYAGVPLIARHGEALGTLCVLDFEPRPFTHKDLELLSVFARRVLAALEWREHCWSPEIPRSAFRYLDYLDRDLGIFGTAGFRDLAIVEAARSAETGKPVACAMVAVPMRRMKELASKLQALHPRSFLGRVGHARLGWLVSGVSAENAREVVLSLAAPHSFVEAVELSGYGSAVETALHDMERQLGDAGLA